MRTSFKLGSIKANVHFNHEICVVISGEKQLDPVDINFELNDISYEVEGTGAELVSVMGAMVEIAYAVKQMFDEPSKQPAQPAAPKNMVQSFTDFMNQGMEIPPGMFGSQQGHPHFFIVKDMPEFPGSGGL